MQIWPKNFHGVALEYKSGIRVFGGNQATPLSGVHGKGVMFAWKSVGEVGSIMQITAPRVGKLQPSLD
jgi:hypothetical protein